jgi:hypothetical protein
VLAIQDRTVSFSNPGVRDFLERAVIEDRFLPAAIGAITEFAEVNHTWMRQAEVTGRARSRMQLGKHASQPAV